MKSNRFSHITLSTITIVMTFLLCISATSVMAQNTGRTLDRLEKERIDKTIKTPQNIEEFRAEIKHSGLFANPHH